MIRCTGIYELMTVACDAVKAFAPNPLPVCDPAIKVEGRLVGRLVAAEKALSRLDPTTSADPGARDFCHIVPVGCMSLCASIIYAMVLPVRLPTSVRNLCVSFDTCA